MDSHFNFMGSDSARASIIQKEELLGYIYGVSQEREKDTLKQESDEIKYILTLLDIWICYIQYLIVLRVPNLKFIHVSHIQEQREYTHPSPLLPCLNPFYEIFYKNRVIRIILQSS